jgi:hypothetical protein
MKHKQFLDGRTKVIEKTAVLITAHAGSRGCRFFTPQSLGSSPS